jgi:peptidoglycan/LPS O-acetylase OafA/YrhL
MPLTPECGRGVSWRFVELDAFRGLAALAVVVFHASYFVGYRPDSGRTFYAGTPLETILRQFGAGVVWFFVLSGFLIFLPFARAAIHQSERVAPVPFLARRAVRLLPLYYFAFILIWMSIRGSLHDPWRDLFLHLTFTHVFDREHFLWTIGPAWSLGVEVMFYLFIAGFGPLTHCACGALLSRRARGSLLAWSIAGLAGASLAYTNWAYFGARIALTDLPVYAGPVAMFHTFALGMELAIVVVLAEGRAMLRPAHTVLLRLGWIGLSLFAILLRIDRSWGAIYFDAIFGLAFALLLASTVLGKREATWRKLLIHPVLQFLGLISYSIYLWHESITWILFQAQIIGNRTPQTFPLSLVLVLAVVIAAASASYWAIERPTRRLRVLFLPARTGRVRKDPIAQ